MSVSRPKTVMNHGMPAAGSCPIPSPPRIRSAARSATDWRERLPKVVARRVRSRGTLRCHAASDSRTCSRSSPKLPLDDVRLRLRARERRDDVDAQLPELARGELEPEADARAVDLARPREEHLRLRAVPRASSRTSWFEAASKRTAAGRGSGGAVSGLPSEKSCSFTEMMSAKSVATSSSSSNASGRPADVQQHHVILHPLADEALARDRERVLRRARRRPGCGDRRRPRSTRPSRTRAAAAARR